MKVSKNTKKKVSQQTKALQRVKSTKRKNQSLAGRLAEMGLSTLAKNLPGPLGFGANALVQGIRAIGGFGDYKVDVNSIGIEGTTGGVPQFNVPRSMRVTHRECLGTVTSPGSGFTIVKNLVINPSNAACFPWLQQMASNFIMYDVKGMVFYFETNTSDAVASGGGLGSVCMATRYDSREPAFSSMVEMQNAMFSISAKPSLNICHPIECKKGFQPVDTYYVRRGDEISSSYNYDKGTFYLATEGLSATAGTVIGRLWVTYDIEFKSPALSPSVSSPSSLPHCYYKANANASGIRSNGLLTLGTSSVLTLGSNLLNSTNLWPDSYVVGKPIAVNLSGQMRIYRKGTYIFMCNFTGTSLPTTTPYNPFTYTTGGSGVTYETNVYQLYETATLNTYFVVVNVLTDNANDFTGGSYLQITETSNTADATISANLFGFVGSLWTSNY